MPEDKLLDIKKRALVAMFSDDDLMDRFVLKGGNVLDLVYHVALRASVDLDFSIEEEFAPDESQEVASKIQKLLEESFRERDLTVFDVKFTERPRHISDDLRGFWGGYRIEFKLIETDKYRQLADRPRDVRVNAMDLGPGHRKAFRIDISKFEYCRPKRPREVDGATVYVYTPEMMVFEKLRAICQQMPQYARSVRSTGQTARARDFFDIYTIVTNFKMDLTAPENVELLKRIFLAKRVPLSLIGLIPEFRDYHRPDFVSVENTVKPGISLKSFDFYFDYVVDHCCRPLEPLWIE